MGRPRPASALALLLAAACPHEAARAEPPPAGPLWTEAAPRRGAPPPTDHALDRGLDRALGAFARLAHRLVPAVVHIATVQGEGDPDSPAGRRVRARGLGTGVVIHRRGYIVTNQHVIDHADAIRVRLADERVLSARVVGADERTDLALLQVDAAGDLPVAPFGDSDRVEIGEWVVAVGNPFGLDHTVTAGIVSGKGRRDVHPGGGAQAGFYDFLQTDAAINAGNSGGPLINARGEVIGINTAMNASAQGIAFAIPINMVKAILPLLAAHGCAPRAWLGAALQPLTPPLRVAFGLTEPQGALVAEVAPGSPAAACGLRPGDVVLSLDDHPIRHAGDLEWRVATASAGRAVKLVVRRAGARLALACTLTADPAAPAAPAPDAPRHASPLGLVVAELSPAHAAATGLPPDQRGVVVVQVEPGSPASEAGLERGDVLVRIGDRDIAAARDYADAVRAVARGAVIKLLARRDGKSRWAAFEKR